MEEGAIESAVGAAVGAGSPIDNVISSSSLVLQQSKRVLGRMMLPPKL